MNVFPLQDFPHSWTNNSWSPISSGPLSPLATHATHAHKPKAGLKKQAFIFEDSASETSESDNDSDPAPEEPSQAGPSQQRHAVRGNESSQVNITDDTNNNRFPLSHFGQGNLCALTSRWEIVQK